MKNQSEKYWTEITIIAVTEAEKAAPLKYNKKKRNKSIWTRTQFLSKTGENPGFGKVGCCSQLFPASPPPLSSRPSSTSTFRFFFRQKKKMNFVFKKKNSSPLKFVQIKGRERKAETKGLEGGGGGEGQRERERETRKGLFFVFETS